MDDDSCCGLKVNSTFYKAVYLSYTYGWLDEDGDRTTVMDRVISWLLNLSSGIENLHVTDLLNNWNFVSLPFNQSVSKTDLIVKYGTLEYTWSESVSYGYVSDFIFGWDRPGQYYTFNDALEPGYGYWLYAYEPCELWVENITITSDDYITGLEADWNIVGVPHDQPVDKTNILVNDISWADAVTAGSINEYVFGWDRTGQSYNFADTFMPGYAYWVYAYQPCVLKRTGT